MKAVAALVADLLAPLCAACGRSCRSGAIVCTRCRRRLAAVEPLAGLRSPPHPWKTWGGGRGPQGLDRVWSSAPHEGVARDLVAALKFRRLLPVAELMAERIEWLAPRDLLGGAVVPVPTPRLRAARRGFDPAAEIAAALATRIGAELVPCLVRRDGGRQVGRRRAQRIGHPPRVHVRGEAPRSALLVDDVLTTGATLSACAGALRRAGAVRVVAITFTRRP